MADERKRRDRLVQRGFECHRLEDELWSLAYEQILPVIRKRAGGVKKQKRHYEKTRINDEKARRA